MCMQRLWHQNLIAVFQGIFNSAGMEEVVILIMRLSCLDNGRGFLRLLALPEFGRCKM